MQNSAESRTTEQSRGRSSRKQGGAANPEKAPLPVVWFKHWNTTGSQTARVLQSTMGSGKDLQNPGLRRLIINATYWGLEMEDQISAERSVAYTSAYEPLNSGFNYKKLGVAPHPPAFYR